MIWRRRHEPSDDAPSVTDGRWIIWYNTEDYGGFPIAYFSSCDDWGEPDYETEGDYRGSVEDLQTLLTGE